LLGPVFISVKKDKKKGVHTILFRTKKVPFRAWFVQKQCVAFDH